jgi:gamma-glutamyltranspeptidase/glutathione hydrolase
MKKILLLLLISFWFISCKNNKVAKATHHLVADTAMVVSANPLASNVGVQILKQGGNAVDAMVATNFALAVVYPRAGNIGGGGFMIIRIPDGQSTALDYRETAPAKAHKNLYLDENGNVIEGLSRNGGLAVGVPGTVAGLYKAWQKYGAIKDWSKLIEPAIKLAQNGFPISETEAHRLNKYKDDFLKYNPNNHTFIKDRWLKGDILKQPELAKTLQIIADKGPKGFYEGEVAEAIVDKVTKSGGIIKSEDLKNYTAKFRQPIIVPYKNYKVISMPPPSSGGVALGQLLQMVEPYPIKQFGFHSFKATHLMVEAEKRVYADRAKYLGDTDFYPVPVDSLLNKDYLKKRMADFSFSKATPSDHILAGEFQLHKESFETTHISIIFFYRVW